MKFNKSILVAGAVLVSFASCETKLIEPTQADIDKEVAVKVMEVRNQLQADCDASIETESMRLADSTIIARGNKPAPVAAAPAPAPRPKTKPKTKAPVKASPPPPPPPPNQGKKNNASGSNQGKKGDANATKSAPQGQNMGKKK